MTTLTQSKQNHDISKLSAMNVIPISKKDSLRPV